MMTKNIIKSNISLITFFSAFFIISSTSLSYDTKECYIWFEVNSDESLRTYMKHAKGWNIIGDLIVTSTIYNVEYVTNQLMAFDFTIISGFKTASLFNESNIYDVEAWIKIAQKAIKISDMTNGKAVILENEGTIKQLLSRGIDSINVEKLTDLIGAQRWPEIWFWYAPMGQREPVRTLAFDIARAIKKGIPNSRLIEASSSAFVNSNENLISKSNLKRTFILDKNPISIVYLDDKIFNFWRLSETRKAVNSAIGNTVIIYPGFGDISNSEAVKSSLLGSD